MYSQDVPRKVRPQAATPEQFQTLLDELSLLYLDYWLTDRHGCREAAQLEVADYTSLFQPYRWYTNLLQTVVPIWTPGAKKVRCWSIPSVPLEVARRSLFLFIEVDTGQPYALLSGQPVADHFIPGTLAVRLTMRDLVALIDRVKSQALHVQAVSITKEHQTL